MKILFYDIREFELDYLLNNIPNTIEPYFIKLPLSSSSYIDEKYHDIDALSVFVSSELTCDVLSKFKNLKFIFLRCVGYSNVDLDYCKENNIYVFNTPNYGNSTVAEYVFSLLLSLCKKIPQSKDRLLEGEADADELIGVELLGKTLGVIGAGAIGRKVISIAEGFKMDILAYDINPSGPYNFVGLEELLQKSDFITINCPLTSETRGLINRDAFLRMKKDAVLINTARGEIVDTEDLYNALVEKRIKGAALDVVECEETLCQSWDRCSNHEVLKEVCLKKFFFIQKLMQLDNVIITPHNAYNTKEAQTRILKITLSNIQSSFNMNSGTKNLVLI